MSKINLWQIIKTSWHYTYGNKKLWIIALLVAFGGFFWQYNFQDWSQFNSTLQLVEQNGQIPILVWVIMIALVFIISFVLFLLSLWFRASLVYGIDKIRQMQEFKLKELLKLGWHKIASLFGIEVLVGLVNLLFFVPAIILSLLGSPAFNLVMLLTIGITLLFNLFVFIFISYAYFYAILEGKKAIESIKLAWSLFISNWKDVILATLLEIGLLVAIGLAMVMALLILAIPLGLIGVLLLLVAGSSAITILTILGVIVLLVFFALLRGAVNVFLHSYLLQIYWKLKS